MRLIDADALKVDFYDEYETEVDVYAYEYVSKHQIDSAPTIEPKRGEWVRYMGDIWTCTACGESLMCDDIECNNYCPNCGARMKGADDE